MLSGDPVYIEGLHFFEVESADDIRGRKNAKDVYFATEPDARLYFDQVVKLQKYVWLTEIGDCHEYTGKWRVYDWSPAVTASEFYPYLPLVGVTDTLPKVIPKLTRSFDYSHGVTHRTTQRSNPVNNDMIGITDLGCSSGCNIQLHPLSSE